MSLINEALKRARQESRRREALAKGLPLAPPPRPTPHRSWLTAAVVAMALALLLSLATIARLATYEPARTATASTSPAPPEATAGSTGFETAASEETGNDARVDAVPASERRQPAAATQSAVDESDLPTEKSSPSMQVPEPATDRVEASIATDQPEEEPVANPAAATPAQAGLAALPAEGVGLESGTVSIDTEDNRSESPSQPRIFVEKMTLASGEVLELGGIAWSETGPYALLDERVVGLGESIMGYMVTRIAPQEVELQGGDGTILIRLK